MYTKAEAQADLLSELPKRTAGDKARDVQKARFYGKMTSVDLAPMFLNVDFASADEVKQARLVPLHQRDSDVLKIF